MKRLFYALFAFSVVIACAGIATLSHAMAAPPQNTSSDAKMSLSVEQGQNQIDQMVGYPSIVNGFEKRMVRMLYELRDNPNLQTYTYMVTMTGKAVKICNSIGYGINASIQFSNPEKIVVNQRSSSYGSVYGTLPQMEPNGLAMPEGLAATYVMCQSPDNPEEISPVYLEPDIIVLPYQIAGAVELGS